MGVQIVNTAWEWPGSRWWRVDFHAHTPKSYDYQPESARENLDWAGWIKAARDAGIQAIAITDHNTAEAVGPLQEAAAEIEGAPVLFPGVELTASGGSHLLVLLDPARQQQHVEELLSRVGVSTDQRGRQESRSPLSAEKILDELGNEALVLGAHVNGSKGVLELGPERNPVLKHPFFAAAEIHPCHEIESGWLDGSRPEIGRRIPQVWSSDGHSLEALGQRFTWVKMTKPNLEGLRLALLDGAGSLELPALENGEDPNTHADLALESITVRDGKFIGRPTPMTVGFSPWLNAVIGGRGTGKSTLIDFCRKTLRRESELDGSEGGEEGPLREYFDSRMSVPTNRTDEGLLTGDTVVEMVYRKDGQRFLLSWSPKGDSVPIARLDGKERTPQGGNVTERFPVRIYSQKQLFALARDQNALLAVIDDSPNVRRAELDRSMEQKANQYLSLRAAARQARKSAEDLPNRLAELDDIESKLEILQKGGHAQAMKEYRTRRQQNDTWQAILRGALQAVEEVEGSADALTVADLDLDDSEDDPAEVSLRRGHESLRRTVENLQRNVQDAVVRVRREIDQINSGRDAERWRRAMSDSECAFTAAAAELAEKGISDPSQYASLVELAAELRRGIEILNGENKLAQELDSQAMAALEEYRMLRGELNQRRRLFTEDTSGETIRVEVSGYADSQDLGRELRKTLGTEHYKSDIELIVKRIRGEQREPWDWEGLDDVVVEMRRLHSGEVESWQAKDRRFESFLKRVTPESVDRLALYLPEDTVKVQFRESTASEWKVLAQGSPGQQTAALLSFVLGYGDEPILLDQPEDDLDSTLIYELLVSRIRETKLKRQVIVVTHNPNIVVHGDAEMVLSLESASGQSRIACQGGLQERAVRDEICRVMEGGREAFESRYQRIMPPEALGP